MPKPTATATARRLSDLLQEQQEPFLQRHGATAAPHQRRRYLLADACGRRLRRLHRDRRGRGANAKALQRRGLFAGCFPCASRQRFRRLPSAGAGDVAGCCDAAMVDCGSTQLSPVSVLELDHQRSHDDESPDHCNWGRQDDDGKPTTTSGPSPPPSNLGPTAGANAIVGTGGDQRKRRGAFSLPLPDKEQAVVSAWERIAADISRIPTLVALDLSASGSVAGEEEEARRLVGQSIEAMIFEEVRWEAVRDMIPL